MPDYVGPLLTLWWLWRMPWASAVELSRMTGQTPANVATQLNRRTDLVYRARLGRRGDPVVRYAFHPMGVERMEGEHGWLRAWHHAPVALRCLHQRLELVEFCYSILPVLWKSTLTGPWGSIAAPAGLYDSDGRDLPAQALVFSNKVNLVDLQWLPGPRIDLVAVYQSADDEELKVYLPIAFYGNYQKPSDEPSLQEELEAVLVPGDYWGDGPPDEEWLHFYSHITHEFDGFFLSDPVMPKRELCFPSLLVVVPNPVVGLKVLRHEKDKDPIDMGVIDMSGRVIQPLRDMCLYWSGIRPPRRRVLHRGFEALQERVENSHWTAVNGANRWAIFKWVHDWVGCSRQEIFDGCGIARRSANPMIDAQIAAKLMHEISGQLYLTDLGLVVYAQSEGTHATRLRERLGEYAREGESRYRDRQASHNLKTAQAGVKFGRDGDRILVFTGIDTTWDFPDQGTQVRPDCVLLHESPEQDQWVVVCGEVEQNAETPWELMNKLRTFARLAGTLDDLTLPAVILTLTRRAAENVVDLAKDMGVVVTDLDTFMNQFPANCWAAEYPDNSDPAEPPDHTIYFDHSLDHFIKSRLYPAWTLTIVPFGPQPSWASTP